MDASQQKERIEGSSKAKSKWLHRDSSISIVVLKLLLLYFRVHSLYALSKINNFERNDD